MRREVFNMAYRYINIITKVKPISLIAFLYLIIIINSPSKADQRLEVFLKIQEQSEFPVSLDIFNQEYVKFIDTKTPWHDDIVRYTGVFLDTFLKRYEIGGATEISISAMNGYTVDADIRTLVNAGAMLVWRMNDAPISVYNKGPIVIIFPWSQREALREDIFTSLAVWHVKAIHIR